MILQGFPEKRKILQRHRGKGGDGWKCTALTDAADCGCCKSIDDLMTSWKYRGAERLRYRQAQLEMLFYLPTMEHTGHTKILYRLLLWRMGLHAA